ncbi:MAG: HelD family protein [Acidimicrobiia bacterium]
MADDLALEQASLEDAHAALAAMQARARHTFARMQATGGFDDLDHEVALRRRIAVLGDSPRPLVFGRIDDDGPGGERWYIGRRHVEDDAGDPVVVEWRTRVAEPFYRARPADPMGLARRRHLMVEGRKVLSYSDDVFGDGAGNLGDVRIRGGDALIAELERARTGQMLDIVATIQVEQDEVIRAPLAGVLAVQGGPGTGKTAIGLHRAAYLLYHHPELARAEVLVLGPSRAFLGYIAQVLPSLGEEAVLQVTIADLVPKVRVRGEESVEVRRVKGDARMAVVIATALAQRRAPIADPIVVRIGRTRVVVTPDELDEMVAAQVARRVPYNVGRAALRTQLASFVHRRHGMVAADPEGVRRAIRSDPALHAALDTAWPSAPATTLVRSALSDPAVLGRAAAGVLDDDEQRALLRPARAPWAAADLALLDEARALLDGHTSTYGHVVADEAQDLSPMELRMIARRSPTGSVTVLGDLAQATGAWHHASWAEVVAHLAMPDGWRQTDLTLGYRAPAPVLELASRLLPVAAPEVSPTEAVRQGSHPVAMVHVAEEELLAAVVRETVARSVEGALTACIVAPEQLEAVVRAFADAGVVVGLPDRDGLARPVTVLPAPAAKGLEFDEVVVVEPAAIAGDDARGLRLLYVALTRPIQRLTVVHARPLPSELAV